MLEVVCAGAARRALGMWPSPETIAERTITVVEERIQAAASDEERGRWIRFREEITGTGRDLLVDILGAVITRQITEG